MGECTSNNNKRLFSILVSYFDGLKGESVVEHYESIECIVVNVEKFFQEIASLFLKDNILWNNLVSHLSDSTNYMRDKKKVNWKLSFVKRHPTYSTKMETFVIISITLLKSFVLLSIISENA